MNKKAHFGSIIYIYQLFCINDIFICNNLLIINNYNNLILFFCQISNKLFNNIYEISYFFYIFYICITNMF